MTEIMMIGIDLGKKHFQLCAVGPRGTRLWSRSYSASKMRTHPARTTDGSVYF